MIQSFDQLLAHAAGLPPRRVAVISPSNAETFQAIREAQNALRASFILTGDAAAIKAGLEKAGADVSRVEIRNSPDIKSALKGAIESVKTGESGILMKGGVDTSTMMKAVLDENNGLRTGRLLSDVFVLEYPPRKGNRFIITVRELTADDVKKTVDWVKDPNHGCFFASAYDVITNVEIIDPYTVKVTVNKPNAAFSKSLVENEVELIDIKSNLSALARITNSIRASLGKSKNKIKD